MTDDKTPDVPAHVPARYVWLTHRRTLHPGTLFPINSCSLLEYIGVEWCSRIPEREHLRYMTQVFDTLAAAGNDEAAKQAFQVVWEIYKCTEFETRFIVRSYHLGGYGKFVVDLTHSGESGEIAAAIRRELHYEFLEFVRKRFWAMPVASNDPKEIVRDEITGPHLLLLETRKEMARAVIGMWKGVMGDRNDELAWAILCGMIYPGINVCENIIGGRSNKQINDYIVAQLRPAIGNQTAWSQGSNTTLAREYREEWKHWMMLMGNQTPAILREMLAKTRAATIGWEGVLEDILARKALLDDPLLIELEVGEISSSAIEAQQQTL